MSDRSTIQMHSTYLFSIQRERTLALTLGTASGFDFYGVVFLIRVSRNDLVDEYSGTYLIVRTQYDITNTAIVLQILQLREHTSTTRNNTADTNEAVQMYLSNEWIRKAEVDRQWLLT